MPTLHEHRAPEPDADKHRVAGVMALLTGKQVAAILALPTSSVYEYARRNLLPVVRIGRNVRFRVQDVETFIESGGQALPGGWRMEPDEATK